MRIPLINIAPLREESTANQALSEATPATTRVVEEIAEALRDIGFFYVQGHGISTALQDDLRTHARSFFAQPDPEKQKIRMEHTGLAWKGYFAVGAELTSGRPDQKEGLYFGTELPPDHPDVQSALPMHGPNQWPSYDDGSFRQTVLAYMDAMTELGHLLMAAISRGLGLQADYFAQRFTTEPTRLFRIFHYPPHTWDENEDEWGVRQHTDMGFLTILQQDNSGGLQVRTREGTWLDAPPIENTFIINIGDMLELWTWGILKANLHRVKNPAPQGRLSFPFFFDPNWHGTLERIDRDLLNPTLLAQATSDAEQRWDGLDLKRLNADTTYGEFVWSKIKHVFPQLVPPHMR